MLVRLLYHIPMYNEERKEKGKKKKKKRGRICEEVSFQVTMPRGMHKSRNALHGQNILIR